MWGWLERGLRKCVEWLVQWLPVKVIRDEQGRPFLERYHLFSLTNDGPGVCIHHFVRSDPDRGYHDHPWKHAASIILAGGYEERVVSGASTTPGHVPQYITVMRRSGRCHGLSGENYFHRVLLPEGSDCWTLFFFGARRKTWGMIDFEGRYHAMSRQIQDADGGWWRAAQLGASVTQHTRDTGAVVACVDIVVRDTEQGRRVLLIKRGKAPCLHEWGLPGGRIEQGDADLVNAALRELAQETGLQLQPAQLRFSHVRGNPVRDPRGFTLTCVYEARVPRDTKVRAGGDAIDVAWVVWGDMERPKELAFDHHDIVCQVLGSN